MPNRFSTIRKYTPNENTRSIRFLMFFGLSFCATIVYKYRFFFSEEHTQFTWVIDALLLGLMLLKFKKKFVVWLGLLLILKFIGSLIIYDQYIDFLDFLKEVIKTTMFYTFFLVTLVYVRDFNNITIQHIHKFQKWLVVIVCISIIVGLVFDISFFKTYFKLRFGFSGLLYPSSFTSYFVILQILYFYTYNKWNQESSYHLPLLIICACLTGTKSVYMFLAIFIISYFFEKRLYKICWIWALNILALILTILLRNELIDALKSNFKLMSKIYMEYDFITFVLSFRDRNLLEAIDYISKDWSIINFFIGGVNRKTLIVEMGLIDLFLSFGLIGVLLIFKLFYDSIYQHLKIDKYDKTLLGALLLIVLLSGNFFKSFTLAYIIAFIFVFYYRSKNKFLQVSEAEGRKE
jgi:hypothetical protein